MGVELTEVMSQLVTLPPPTAERTFLATNAEYITAHVNYSKHSLDFEQWRESIASKYRKEQKLRDKNLHVEADEEDEEDDDEAVDEEVYAVIPDNYDFSIQSPLKSLDPRMWRDHDHYKVLGLNEFRWATRPEDIKRAHRQLVLKYHPDKGRVNLTDKDINRADLFSCLTKSFEFLQQKKLRRSYDSYDPEFDDDIPSKSKSPNHQFYDIFGPCFKNNSRWSRHLIPDMGDENSTLEDVDAFYNAWYEFESWREFTYEKLEDLDRAENAWERRCIQHENARENKQKRKEEVKRIRSLVDNAYASDPRIKKFQAEERAKKEAEKAKRKQEREAIKAQKLAEEQAIKDAEKKKQDALEAEEKEREAVAKKKREAAKKIVKKSRQALRKFVAEQVGDANAAKCETELNLICSQLDAVQLDEFRGSLQGVEKKELGKMIKGKFEAVRADLRQDDVKAEEEQKAKIAQAKKEKEWAVEEIQLLVKAANVFPAGAMKRWDKISIYFNDHHGEESGDRTPKECMAAVMKLSQSAKDTKGGAASSGDADDAFSSFLKGRKHQNMSKPLNGEISQDYSTQGMKPKKSFEVREEEKPAAPSPTGEQPWTAAEQKLLEQALRTYPANYGKERWDKIGEAVPNRSKRDCMLRYKKIVTELQAKKLAAAKVAKK